MNYFFINTYLQAFISFNIVINLNIGCIPDVIPTTDKLRKPLNHFPVVIVIKLIMVNTFIFPSFNTIFMELLPPRTARLFYQKLLLSQTLLPVCKSASLALKTAVRIQSSHCLPHTDCCEDRMCDFPKSSLLL